MNLSHPASGDTLAAGLGAVTASLGRRFEKQIPVTEPAPLPSHSNDGEIHRGRQ